MKNLKVVQIDLRALFSKVNASSVGQPVVSDTQLSQILSNIGDIYHFNKEILIRLQMCLTVHAHGLGYELCILIGYYNLSFQI